MQYYVKLSRTAGCILFFKITGKLTPETTIKLRLSILQDILELKLNAFNMALNKVRIKLPTSVTIPLNDNLKIRRILKRDPLFFHIMLTQVMTWFPLMSKDDEEPV